MGAGEWMIRMPNLRQVAAADMALHGARLAIAEFAIGVLLPAVLGPLSLLRGRSRWQAALGAYLILLALNYLPLLLFAVRLRTQQRAEVEVADLLDDHVALVRLSKQSLLLVIPILPVISTFLPDASTRSGSGDQRP